MLYKRKLPTQLIDYEWNTFPYAPIHLKRMRILMTFIIPSLSRISISFAWSEFNFLVSFSKQADKTYFNLSSLFKHFRMHDDNIKNVLILMLFPKQITNKNLLENKSNHPKIVIHSLLIC